TAHPRQVVLPELREDGDHRGRRRAGVVPPAERLILGLEQTMRVRRDGRRVLVDPAPAEGIVREVRGIAAEDPEVRDRRSVAEEIRALREMRAEDAEPRAEDVVDPESDRLRGD